MNPQAKRYSEGCSILPPIVLLESRREVILLFRQSLKLIYGKIHGQMGQIRVRNQKFDWAAPDSLCLRIRTLFALLEVNRVCKEMYFGLKLICSLEEG